ncbi:nuclear transport factor 2 family protein [Streptomyces bobili]|uniref:nuclear transport factor 2 family protein n=1 Tax=Streptomyces bobili TaxID=67280 RepID=UPI0033B7DAA4
MQARDWTGLGDLLAEDVVVERPVSGERIEGRGNFMSVNSECPEGWAIKVLRLLPSGDVVVSEVEVPHETMGVHRVVSFWSGPSRKDRRRSGVLDGAGVGPVAGVAGRVCAAHVIMCGSASSVKPPSDPRDHRRPSTSGTRRRRQRASTNAVPVHLSWCRLASWRTCGRSGTR